MREPPWKCVCFRSSGSTDRSVMRGSWPIRPECPPQYVTNVRHTPSPSQSQGIGPHDSLRRRGVIPDSARHSRRRRSTGAGPDPVPDARTTRITTSSTPAPASTHTTGGTSSPLPTARRRPGVVGSLARVVRSLPGPGWTRCPACSRCSCSRSARSCSRRSLTGRRLRVGVRRRAAPVPRGLARVPRAAGPPPWVRYRDGRLREPGVAGERGGGDGSGWRRLRCGPTGSPNSQVAVGSSRRNSRSRSRPPCPIPFAVGVDAVRVELAAFPGQPVGAWVHAVRPDVRSPCDPGRDHLTAAGSALSTGLPAICCSITHFTPNPSS